MSRTERRRGALTRGDDALERLEEAIREAGSAKKWATAAGITEAYVSDVRLGRRAPGPAILLALGLVRVVTYTPAAEVRS